MIILPVLKCCGWRAMPGVIVFFGLVASVAAQTYPSRPVRIIVPFGPGAGGDVTTRIVFDEVSRQTGANFVIENRPGALGITGTLALLNASHDGYSLMMSGTSTHSLAASLSKAATYDPVKDFTHVIIMTSIPATILVRESSPYDSITALIDDVRSHPGKLTYGFAAGSQEIVGVKFHRDLHLDSRRVPYKLSQAALIDMLGGRLDYIVISATEAVGLTKGNQARALVILNGERSSLLPGVPALTDLGLPLAPLTGWTGIAGPVGMPAEATNWLAVHIRAALDAPATVAKLNANSIEVVKPVDATEWVRAQFQNWTEGAKEADFKPE